ncbi:MAG: bifunctional (p)ppGpp synthetase/guanosine-3',5'-bis(diphosphate) 3'-pyrophosphohydrolase [Desulfobacterales bacterium]|nr:bifunctional (p)ppGpp synthetase/guanosine-3',5'-bis(diphosphate) 3'-pyrophosphohydrolase [Desulfobacterales bacterium]
MIRITDILDKVADNNPDADQDIIDRAYIYSAKVHEGQMRLSGEPYLTHPLEVAYILADMKLDSVSIAAALLHDVIEDTHATKEEITDIFGTDVSHIVSGVTKLSSLAFDSLQARQAESIRRMILAMANDIRVILIKLADRLHNMRTLHFHKVEQKKIKIAQETHDIYAPTAARLGIYWMKKELEDTAFMYLQPEEYSKIKNLVHKDKEEREQYVATVKDYIKKKMNENGLECEVTGRYKYFYSIYKKMVDQDLSFEEIYDIIAFRIILDTIPQCYEALGHIHSLWKPVPKKIKDYIGVPKPNMYQSLHTTVIGPYGERIEIQIRTWEMDKVAESGIAAHWGYKEGKRIDEKVTNTFAWIQKLVDNQQTIRDPDEFMENVRIDLFPDEVYVFTPKGEIKSIAKGATPVDFAYLIHSEVGDQCVGAKVNGHIVPLQYVLKNGNIVEIITSKNHHPSKDWLRFVKTVKARSRIRQWIKTQERERSITLGREICEKAFRKYSLNFNELLKSKEMQKAVEDFGFKMIDDLIVTVGYGKITPLQIVRKLVPTSQLDKEKSILTKIIGHVKKKKPKTGVVVHGIDDILIKFGKCCQPVPGDSITGYITQGYGVTVHRTICVNALKTNPERQIDVEWDKDIAETYPVKIIVRSNDRIGLLADIAASISKHGSNIVSAKTETMESGNVEIFFTIYVKNIDQLNALLSEIKKVKFVYDASRKN